MQSLGLLTFSECNFSFLELELEKNSSDLGEKVVGTLNRIILGAETLNLRFLDSKILSFSLFLSHLLANFLNQGVNVHL